MKPTKKDKRRLLIWSLTILILVIYLGVFSFKFWNQIFKSKQIREDLNVKYEEALAKEEVLNDEVNKLQDPEYVAKYAREKHMYTKEGELIIRVTED